MCNFIRAQFDIWNFTIEVQFFFYSKIIIIFKCGRKNIALYKYMIVF